MQKFVSFEIYEVVNELIYIFYRLKFISYIYNSRLFLKIIVA